MNIKCPVSSRSATHLFRHLPGPLALLLCCLTLLVPLAQAGIDQHTDSVLEIRAAQWLSQSSASGASISHPAQINSADLRPLSSSDWTQGVSDQVYWVRFELHNPTEQNQAWVLQHETSYLDDLHLFWRPHGVEAALWQQAAARNHEGFSSRDMDYRKPAFLLHTDAGETTEVWARLQQFKPDAVSLRLQISEQTLFNQVAYRHTLLQGGFFGTLIALTLLTLALALMLRSRLFLSYGIYLVFTSLMWVKLSGIGFQYLWPGLPMWHKDGFHIIYLATAMAAWVYSQVFFSLRTRLPSVNRAINGLLVILATGIVLRLLGLYEAVLYWSFFALGSLILLPVLGAWMWSRGHRFARWYTVGWFVYSIGLLVSVVSAVSDWLPWGMSWLAYTQAASLVEVLFLSLALADKLVNLERERAEAVTLSQIDPLTGLGNRRQLTQAYQDLQTRDWSRRQECVALLMIDLDRFKTINDEYGHDAGDAVLRQLADDLRRICRKQDTLIRFGGEEFALLLALDDMAAAISIAERIRMEFAQHPTVYEGQLIPHTLSIGVVEVTADGHLLSTRRMMQEADDALYFAKTTGRNATVVKQQGEYVRCSPITA